MEDYGVIKAHLSVAPISRSAAFGPLCSATRSNVRSFSGAAASPASGCVPRTALGGELWTSPTTGFLLSESVDEALSLCGSEAAVVPGDAGGCWLGKGSLPLALASSTGDDELVDIALLCTCC